MNYRLLRWFSILFGLVLVGSWSIAATAPFCQAYPDMPTQNATARRVYVPYDVSITEATPFWFGQVTPSENYTDGRIRYTDDNLILTLGIIDRLVWYDTTPSPSELGAWDSASLYLCRGGNVGSAPATDCFRFDAQVDWVESERAAFQAAYQGDGSQWVSASVVFTTSAGLNGNAPNDTTDDRGWMLYYTIPFASLGLSAPPAHGTVWGLGLAVHDRDSVAGPSLADQVWPEMLETLRPATWGQLIFGLKPAYAPASALPGGTAVIRHGVNGAEVMDADVGGSSVCGATAGPDFFPTWGALNYVGKTFLNIQHLDPISEWPCFSKYYVTFPLDSVPEGKVVLSATMTLYQFGNAGEGLDPQPSFIQVFTINEDWEESILTWNNAPLAGDYVAATWVDPLNVLPSWPGIPRHWDVSSAVAEAYTAGEPLRLVLYSPDWAFHSGKYFYSSDIGGGGEGRPTLTVAWGQPGAQLEKQADKGGADYGESIEYVLGFRGTGVTLMLTDTLPSAVLWAGDVVTQGTDAPPVYHPGQHQLTWTDTPASGKQVFITYTVSVNTLLPEPLVNTGELVAQAGYTSRATSTVIANPFRCYLPILLKL